MSTLLPAVSGEAPAAEAAAPSTASVGSPDEHGGADGQDHVLWWTDEEVALLL